MTTKFSLQVCRFPGQYQEHPRSSGYLISLMANIPQDFKDTLGPVTPYTVSDTPITMSRNRAVKHALDKNVDYILMIDSDMAPDLYLGVDPVALPFFGTAWGFMMNRRSCEEGVTEPGLHYPPATIAAPYCGPPPDENCYIFEWKNRESDHPNPDFKLEMISREKAAIMTGVQEVAALPTGLILYDARLFRNLPVPWFDYEYIDENHTHKASTEDVYQTRNASMLGMPQYVAWDCWAGHVKLKTVGKPKLLSPDMVAKSLRDAMSNPASDQRLKMIVENDDFRWSGVGRQ